KGTVPVSKWLSRGFLLAITAPFIANSAGRIFTEMGRQPFVVAPNPAQRDGADVSPQAAPSPELSPGRLPSSRIRLTAVYGGLMVVELRLLTTYVKGGVASAMPELASSTTKPTITDDGEDVLSFAY